ncbi:RNA polymerase sigma-70 factor [Siphonobacter sp. SORGH_AS_1065]|uniref:RNA polymerase sigma-70 factor n=1 Tax=Siphonobacter sp. SORGH_AS_1065 TaxID=3041795 RepID=UPI002782C7A2|nr:RNA polymerase sigma-70 factor [Siphonobacter sp. SORGH_AS_1065]MDQ1089191.1 RNA polymerase sigma-70 factor (family 1) [Siphonobacter sp. SORGH_AS_1065]
METKVQPDSFSVPDAQSFERLYIMYWKKVYAVCYNQLKDIELAQGMVQDIFLSLWERRASLVIASSMEHYLVRAAKLKVFEYFRNKAIQEKHLEQVRLEQKICTRCTEFEVEYEDLHTKLQSLVEHLPCQCKKVYELRGEGLSNKEIAHTLTISEKAVEYHITRALQFLKAKLPTVLNG